MTPRLPTKFNLLLIICEVPSRTI